MREVIKVENIHELDYVYNKIIPEETHDFFKNEMYVLLNSNQTYKSGSFWAYPPSEEGYKIISFNEFKSRYELKIGDTFEYNGFVCRVESEVDKWVYDKYQEAYYKTKEWHSNYKEITNKEFIKQLEENAR